MWSPVGMIYRATYNENESNGELAVGRQVLVVQALVYYDFKRQQSRAMTFIKVASHRLYAPQSKRQAFLEPAQHQGHCKVPVY